MTELDISNNAIHYTEETIRGLMINYILIPDEGGNVWAYDLFWNPKFNKTMAPAALVYAKLMIGDNKRNREIASIIFNEEIKV